MCRKCLRWLLSKLKPLAPFQQNEEDMDPGIHADVRNAAQRFSSSSRLVALKASRDTKETERMLEKLKLAQEAIAVANDAVRLVEKGREHGSG
jgi:hypothetical protein